MEQAQIVLEYRSILLEYLSVEINIQYAPVNGGAVACWSMGEGPALIQMPSIPFSHLQMEWADPDWNAWYRGIGAGFQLIRYDPRGCGLSGPASDGYGMEAMIEDFEAVANRFTQGRFAILAPVQAGPAAIVFAARNPGRVSRLILWCAISRADELRTTSFEALRALGHADWALFTETAAHALVAGWENSDAAHRMAAIMRAAASTAIHEAVLGEYLATDISDELGRVSCPVLVAYRMQGRAPLPASARYLAAAIPNASLRPFHGSSLLFVGDDGKEIAGAFREFLMAGDAEAPTGPPFGFQTLVYSDIERHTEVFRELGDERGRTVLREVEHLTRAAIGAQDGSEVLATGDGFLARFATSQAALEYATELQRSLAEASAGLPKELRVRIGINAGEPIVEGSEVHGASVLGTRAIADLAAGGEVLVANVVRELVSGKGFAFADRGLHEVAGIAEAVRLWELLYTHTST